ncbi:hypothetical protein CF392_10770, partial [Tamilnaduibacter salinus]
YANHSIRPIALDVQDIGADDCQVDVLGLERTFFEKLTLLHEINHRGHEKLTERQSRHIYDLVSLHRSFPELTKDLSLLEEVVSHKKKYFRRGASRWGEAVPGSLYLVPDGLVRERLEADWEKMDDMFPDGRPMAFSQLLEELAEINRAINEEFGVRQPPS